MYVCMCIGVCAIKDMYVCVYVYKCVCRSPAVYARVSRTVRAMATPAADVDCELAIKGMYVCMYVCLYTVRMYACV